MPRPGPALLLLFAVAAHAGEHRGPRLDVLVPELPREHERLRFFDRRHHHLAPGTVTIGKPGYVCDVHHRAFRDRDLFVAHLRIQHRVPPDHIPDVLVTHGGQVHFAGEAPPLDK